MQCSECDFYRAVEGNRGYCFNEPPKVLLMPVSVDKPDIKNATQQEVIVQPVSVRPVVNVTDVCGRWVSMR